MRTEACELALGAWGPLYSTLLTLSLCNTMSLSGLSNVYLSFRSKLFCFFLRLRSYSLFSLLFKTASIASRVRKRVEFP